MKLFNYFRSSASYRVRIALEIKGLSYDYIPVHLVRAEHHLPAYASKLGDPLLPALDLNDGHTLVQSMAIIEYLDEMQPEPPLLPRDALGRAQVRALAQMIACEIHPINNLRVLKHLTQELHLSDEARSAWYHHWTRSGLEAFERQLQLLAAERTAAGRPPSQLCWGDQPTLADCCLAPQIFNAQRFKVDLQGLPLTMAAWQAAVALPPFQRAHPSVCPDAEA